MPLPPKDNLDLFSSNLFGSTMPSSETMAAVGLIRIPMKENPDEPDENAHLYDDPATRSAAVVPGTPQIDAKNFRLADKRNLSAGGSTALRTTWWRTG